MSLIADLASKLNTPRGQRSLESVVNLEFLVIGGLFTWFGWYVLRDSWLPRDGFPRFLLAGLFLVLPLALIYRRIWKIVTCVLIALSMVLFAYAPHPRKTFLSTLYGIQTGMSRGQALSKIGMYPAEFYDSGGHRKGEPWGYADGYWVIRWNTREPQYDADVGRIEFLGDRVANVAFDSD